MVLFTTFPRGSNDPNIEVLGAKYGTYDGFWDFIPLYLGTWILLERGCIVLGEESSQSWTLYAHTCEFGTPERYGGSR